MDDGAFLVVFLEQIENLLFPGLGVQVDEFVLLGGGGDEIFQHLSLRRISRRIFDPVKVQAENKNGEKSNISGSKSDKRRIMPLVAGMEKDRRLERMEQP